MQAEMKAAKRKSKKDAKSSTLVMPPTVTKAATRVERRIETAKTAISRGLMNACFFVTRAFCFLTFSSNLLSAYSLRKSLSHPGKDMVSSLAVEASLKYVTAMVKNVASAAATSVVSAAANTSATVTGRTASHANKSLFPDGVGDGAG